jgi:hypothetical protein
MTAAIPILCFTSSSLKEYPYASAMEQTLPCLSLSAQTYAANSLQKIHFPPPGS